MSVTILTRDDFDSYLESQTSRITRYNNNEEKLTLVFVKAERGLLKKVRPVLEMNLRKSDVMFADSDHIFLVLANTDKTGALHIDKMVKEFLDEDLIYAYSTFPEDGKTPKELFDSIGKICKDQFKVDFFDYLS